MTYSMTSRSLGKQTFLDLRLGMLQWKERQKSPARRILWKRKKAVKRAPFYSSFVAIPVWSSVHSGPLYPRLLCNSG